MISLQTRWSWLGTLRKGGLTAAGVGCRGSHPEPCRRRKRSTSYSPIALMCTGDICPPSSPLLFIRSKGGAEGGGRSGGWEGGGGGEGGSRRGRKEGVGGGEQGRQKTGAGNGGTEATLDEKEV